VGSRSGGSGRTHAPQVAAAGRWRRDCDGGATLSGGVMRIWRWGAPFAVRVAPRRQEAHGGFHGELKGRRRGLRAADGGRLRRRKSGEGNLAARCTKAQTSYTVLLLTSLQCSRGCPQRQKGDGGVEQRRRTARVVGGAGALGFGRREAAQRRAVALNRPAGASWRAGLRGEARHGRRVGV
jgi:hypothetical protein